MRATKVIIGLLIVLPIGIEVSFAQEWHIEVVDSDGIVGKYVSIALDTQEYPHISYYDVMERDLKYARWNGSQWNIQSVDCDEDVGEYTSLALDSMGLPHISYYDHTNGDLKYAHWNGYEWNILTVDFEGNVGALSSITLDDQEYPHVSYINWSSYDLKYASWTGSDWLIETVDFEGRLTGDTSLAIDSDGNPHISYLRDDTALREPKYACWTGSEWNIQIVESGCDVRNDTSLALDSLGRPHISYYEYMEDALRYAKWTGSEWDIQTVDSGAYMNDYCSLALDSSDYPHIAYMRFYIDPWDADLKYARWTGGEWEIQLVDYEGFVGMYASLALDSQDHPHISYLEFVDASNGHLRYARYADVQGVVPGAIVEAGFNKPYPSPARDIVTIEYSLPKCSSVELSIYDLSGRRLATLVSTEQSPGRHEVSWDCADVPNGIYFYRLHHNSGDLNRRFVIIK